MRIRPVETTNLDHVAKVNVDVGYCSSIRFSRLFLLPLVGIMLLQTGCSSEQIQAKASLYEVEHSVSEHWPQSVQDAAAKIQERVLVLSAASAGDASEPVNDARRELDDLLSWVPEIAADTDMPEATWIELTDQSEVLLREFKRDGMSKDLGAKLGKFADTLASSWPSEVNTND